MKLMSCFKVFASFLLSLVMIGTCFAQDLTEKTSKKLICTKALHTSESFEIYPKQVISIDANGATVTSEEISTGLRTVTRYLKASESPLDWAYAKQCGPNCVEGFFLDKVTSKIAYIDKKYAYSGWCSPIEKASNQDNQ